MTCFALCGSQADHEADTASPLQQQQQRQQQQKRRFGRKKKPTGRDSPQSVLDRFESPGTSGNTIYTDSAASPAVSTGSTRTPSTAQQGGRADGGHATRGELLTFLAKSSTSSSPASALSCTDDAASTRVTPIALDLSQTECPVTAYHSALTSCGRSTSLASGGSTVGADRLAVAGAVDGAVKDVLRQLFVDTNGTSFDYSDQQIPRTQALAENVNRATAAAPQTMHSPERRRALQASSPDDASSGLSHASTVFEDATSEWSVSEQSLAGSPGGRADVENEENRPPPSAAGNSQHTKTMASSSPAQKDPARLPPPPSASRPAFKPRAPSPRISAYAALLTAATPPQPKLRPRVSGGRVHLGPWTGPASPSGSSTPLSPSPTDRLRSPEDSGLAGAPTILRVLGSPLESEDSEASLKAWALPEPRAIDWASTAECVAGSGIAEDAPAGVPARLLRPQERPGRRKGSKLLASVVLPAATLVGASFMSGVSIESLLRSAASAAANVRGGTPLDTSSSVAPPPWGPRWPGALRRQTQKQVRAFETSSALSPRTVLSQHSAATAAAARANGSAAPQTPRREALMALAVCSIEPSEAAYQAALAQVSRVLAPAPAALAAPAPTEEKVAEEEVAVELKVTEEAAWSFGDDTLTAEEPEEEAAPPAAGGKAQGAEPEPAATEVEAAPLSAAEAVPAAAVRAPSTAVMVWQQEQTPAARRIEKAHEQPTTAATPETAAEDAPEAAEAAPAAVAATPAENEAPAAVVEVEVAAAEAAGEAVPEAAASSAELVDAAAAPQQPEQEQAEEGSDQRVAAPEESAAADAQSEPAPAGEEASAAPDATAMLAEATQQQEGAETAAAKVERSEAQPSSAQEAQAQSAAVSVDGVGADGAAQQAAAPASSPQQDHPLVMEEQLRATKRKAREAAWAEESVQKRKQQQDAERELAAAAWQATGSPRSAARRREEGATLRPTAQQEQHA